MSREGDGRLIIEKAREIEEFISELEEKVSETGTDAEELITGLKKTIVSMVFNMTRCITTLHIELSLRYLQKTHSLLRTLEYYNYVSRRVGFFSSSPYLRLREQIKDLERHLLLSSSKLRLKEKNTKPKPSLPSNPGDKLLTF